MGVEILKFALLHCVSKRLTKEPNSVQFTYVCFILFRLHLWAVFDRKYGKNEYAKYLNSRNAISFYTRRRLT